MENTCGDVMAGSAFVCRAQCNTDVMQAQGTALSGTCAGDAYALSYAYAYAYDRAYASPAQVPLRAVPCACMTSVLHCARQTKAEPAITSPHVFSMKRRRGEGAPWRQ
uniref:Uncharacterized protein n=1 Tax=Eutreptiella gymnastica TaxID=73025 RepID=A0A6T1YIA1_9EUGL